jgi:DNA-binding NtrC family response regulator
MAQRAKNFDGNGEPGPPDALIFGSSETMAAVRLNLLKVADTNIPVLLEGESGTGKGVVCKFLHGHSAWSAGPLVTVSCPALPGTLLESELLGLWSVPVTGTGALHAGHLEAAGETLFLDEVSELDLSLQGKLLQVLQNGQLQTSSSAGVPRRNVRLICATSRELQREVAADRFRRDLYYAISGLVVRLPALRERLEDLDALVEYFIGLFNRRFGCSAPPLSHSTLLRMKAHPWTGNIRELENLVRRYVLVGGEETILSEIEACDVDAAGAAAADSVAELSLSQMTRSAMRNLEGRIILDTLQANQWNRRRTARALKISYRSLMYKLKQTGIQHRRAGGGAGETTLENQL